jgi:ethanolamine ammonia-lyase small subunit
MNPSARHDPWHNLRRYTPARIAIGRAGASLPTKELLDFQLAHALARDAVHQPFDPQQLERNLAPLNHPILHLQSATGDRQTYLLRPDRGRRLAEPSAQLLASSRNSKEFDVSITLSDGLSSLAAHRQVPPLLAELVPLLKQSRFTLAPLTIVPFARVALQDEIGATLNAKLSLILLGERPGLGSPDSLGAYLVFNPAPGRTDADRNCVSNIRPEGLPPPAAAQTLHYLITQSLRRQLSGVGLKDDRDPRLIAPPPRSDPGV